MMVCSWLSYVDRQILATLSVVILADTGLSTERYTEVVSAFSIAYMIGNPLWGSLLDYVGLRKGMLAAVAIWSVASASHSLVGRGAAAFLGFAAARALLGFGEGATFPGGFRTAMDSLPANRQARGIAISYSGGSLGAIVTPFLVIPIAGRFGWRSAFLVTGALGFLWLALWAKVAKPPYLRVAGTEAGQDHLAEFAREAILGAGLRLFAGRVRAGTDPVFELAVPESRVRRVAGRLEVLPMDSSSGLGSWVFLLGLGGGPVCFSRESARWIVRAADDPWAAPWAR